MLPSGSVHMIFALHDEPFICTQGPAARGSQNWSRGIVHGPQWGYFRSGPKPAGTTIGVTFRPGAAGPILGVPLADLTDLHVPVDALWGADGLELRERLLAAKDPESAFRLLEVQLLSRLKRPLLIHPAVALALAVRSGTWESTRVSDIQKESGYSPRHFVALFRQAVGLTPKHYYRIKRFAAVLQGLASGSNGNLSHLAASAGYSDQAHLTREFREFSGTTPTQYRPRDATSLLHTRASEPLSSFSSAR